MELPSDFSDVLGRLMADPQVMNAVRSLSNENASGNALDTERVPMSIRPDLPPPKQSGNTEQKSSHGKDRNNRAELLKALEPYLSSDRRKKLDGIVRVIELIEFARTTHLLDDLDLMDLPGTAQKK